jgi:hypothetical protein
MRASSSGLQVTADRTIHPRLAGRDAGAAFDSRGRRGLHVAASQAGIASNRAVNVDAAARRVCIIGEVSVQAYGASGGHRIAANFFIQDDLAARGQQISRDGIRHRNILACGETVFSKFDGDEARSLAALSVQLQLGREDHYANQKSYLDFEHLRPLQL